MNILALRTLAVPLSWIPIRPSQDDPNIYTPVPFTGLTAPAGAEFGGGRGNRILLDTLLARESRSPLLPPNSNI